MVKRITRCLVITASLILFMTPDVTADSTTRSLDDYMQWITDQIARWSPPGRTYIPEAQETREEALERYATIASDAMAVAFDSEEKPLFRGAYARSQTMAVILSIALFESGYRKDVDYNLGKRARGDNGQSWCVMQVQLGAPLDDENTTAMRVALKGSVLKFSSDEGWTGGDLIRDRKACFRAGLRITRNSFYACRDLPILDRLSAYTSGSCREGQRESQDRMRTSMEWFEHHIPPLTDQQVLVALQNPPVILSATK